MAHVIVQVNGRPYTMQCPDGEEAHLRDSAKLLDTEVARVKASVGAWAHPPSRYVGPDGGRPALGSDGAHRGTRGTVRGLRESRNAALTEARELEAQFIARLDSASKRLLGLAQDIDG